jgi:hypothetical protein
MAAISRAIFRQIGPDRAAEWTAKGHKLRHFFPHKLLSLPKCGSDGYRLAGAMWGVDALEAHWQLLMYADPALVEDFPDVLFFDDDLIWHQQHFGRRGQVASASIAVHSGAIFTSAHFSDLVQRIGRFREHKTQIENRLRGWPWMLLNGILGFAYDRGIRTVCVPGSRLAMRCTDPARVVQPYLFERIYDRPMAEFPGVTDEGDWWRIDVAAASAAALEPILVAEHFAPEKVVCVFHDLERGLGHRDVDSDLERRANATASAALDAMLAAEADAGVSVTYNVVGQILNEVRRQIESAGHAVAFHSFDHGEGPQLQRCRQLDYRLKGYRPPRSILTEDTRDEHLAFHNFEWLASAAGSLGTETPEMRNRLVRLPVTLDDYPLYTGAQSYEDWERGLLAHVSSHAYTAVGLHDCYSHLWQGAYPQLLDKLGCAARLCTFDELSAEVIFGAAE